MCHHLSLSRQVFTPETQRAKELLDLFNALNAPLLSTDQRLDVLLNVKVCLPICLSAYDNYVQSCLLSLTP